MAADQPILSERFCCPSRRTEFPVTMNRFVAWAELSEVLEMHYPKAQNGRPPAGMERMPRMLFVQHWFNLANAACEKALLDSVALRRLVGIDFGRDRVPNGITLLKSWSVMEKPGVGAPLFAKVGLVIQDQSTKVGKSAIVDTTITSALPATQNAGDDRDPGMHQIRKAQRWYLDMKLHVGVNDLTWVHHGAVEIAAHMHDRPPLPQLSHGVDQEVFYDSDDASRQELVAPTAPSDENHARQRAVAGGIPAGLDRIPGSVLPNSTEAAQPTFPV